MMRYIIYAWALAAVVAVGSSAVLFQLLPFLVAGPIVMVLTAFAWVGGRVSDPNWPETAEERAREVEDLAALRPADDDALPMAKKDERPDPFDNVDELLASPAVERRTDVLAVWIRRRQGVHRAGVKR